MTSLKSQLAGAALVQGCLKSPNEVQSQSVSPGTCSEIRFCEFYFKMPIVFGDLEGFCFSLKENICPSPIFLFLSQKFSYFPGSTDTLFLLWLKSSMLNTWQLYSTFHPRMCGLVCMCFKKLPKLPCLIRIVGQAGPLIGDPFSS